MLYFDEVDKKNNKRAATEEEVKNVMAVLRATRGVMITDNYNFPKAGLLWAIASHFTQKPPYTLDSHDLRRRCIINWNEEEDARAKKEEKKASVEK
jgi:hypothetical protein